MTAINFSNKQFAKALFKWKPSALTCRPQFRQKCKNTLITLKYRLLLEKAHNIPRFFMLNLAKTTGGTSNC